MLFVIWAVAAHVLWCTACSRMQDDRQAEIWYTTGRQWLDMQRLDSAVHYFSKAEEAVIHSTSPILKAKIYSNMADMMLLNKNYNMAIDYFYRALDNYKTAGRKDMESYTLMDIGKCHRMAGDSISTVHSYYDKALSISTNDTITESIIRQIGLSFYFYGMHDSARHYLRKSLEYPCFENGKSIAFLFLGISYCDTQQLDSAECFLLQALNHNPGLRQQIGCYTMLHHVAKMRKDSAAIARYGSLHAEYSDSISAMDAKLSNELHDIQIAKTAELSVQRDRRNYWLVFFLLLTCTVAWRVVLAYRQRKREAKIATAQARKLEETLEQERQRQQSAEQMHEDLMRKYETEEGRAVERKRRAYEKKLILSMQRAEYYPTHHPKHTECLLAACEKHLCWNDANCFITLLDKEFNGFAHKIVQYHFKRRSHNQVTIRLCCLLWLKVPEPYITSIMGYNPKEYRQALSRTCQRFGVDNYETLVTALETLVIEDIE